MVNLNCVGFLLLLAGVQNVVVGFAIERESCAYQLVETMPEKFTYKQSLPFELAKTHEVYLDLINKATKKIQVASFYLCLLAESPEQAEHPSSKPGRLVLEALESAARDRKLKVEMLIGKDEPSWSNQNDLERLRNAGVDLKVLNVTKLSGEGVMHSKFIITDDVNFYVGSANFDWRALSQVKEFGIVYRQCRTLAADLEKVFKTYQLMSGLESVPDVVPTELTTTINKENPFYTNMDNVKTQVYMGASPPIYNGKNNQRSTDLETILDTIAKAKEFVYISVMNYSPVKGWKKKTYWPIIENALKDAVYSRRVHVKLSIATVGKKFRDDELAWYKSLDALKNNGNPKYAGSIEVRFFTVTSEDEFQAKLPHARLKHDKYVVTDNSVFIGTSNWQPDYFIHTCGVGLSIRPTEKDTSNETGDILSNMKLYFERDFNSEYSVNAEDYKQ